MQKYDEEPALAHYKAALEYEPDRLDRYTVLLRDGETTATIYPIHSANDMPDGLLAFLCDEINMEIERGDSYPFFEPMDLDSFQGFWLSHFAGVMILGDAPTLQGPKQWEKECLGSFSIKPNYPGRSGHICTATFLVNAGIRGKGIGRTMADCFLVWAPRLGYTYALFSLVFETNAAIRKIFESTNFKRIGRIKSAGILKGHDSAVDSIIYGKELVTNADPSIGAYRFDKIKFYLETGKYPAMADRAEKSRLRSAASHYRIDDGKLMLRNKEVVSDPVRQIHICTEMHMVSHGGINKTTSMVTEKYHWARIKDTVAAAIKACADCREQPIDSGLVKRTAAKKYPSVVRRKVLQSQPNNPNARHLKSRMGLSVDDMVMRSGDDADDDTMLPHDLALDDNIMAAVEAAQRSQMRGHASYAEAAAAGPNHEYHQSYSDAYANHYDDDDESSRRKRGDGDNIPVDPEVQEFERKYSDNREEIEIARALIEANEDAAESGKAPHEKKKEEANMFLKD
ncbi:Protein spt10 [Yamadazyma tenuis]|uniref:Protein spt10 n=1 Tax=Candida tenuis TaxID=2315449 RepID=UPI0027A5582B|nr:Protein spt10 [Yamadazyma tenuis]